MKFLLVFLIVFPVSLFASDSIICVSDNLQLDIVVSNNKTPESVSWIIKVIDNTKVAISGAGAWQKEVESEDAFSSYDGMSAISYKNRRAVFVMDDGQTIYFPFCTRNTL